MADQIGLFAQLRNTYGRHGVPKDSSKTKKYCGKFMGIQTAFHDGYCGMLFEYP